jgi:ABC-type phosphate transport system substrate-binding protein
MATFPAGSLAAAPVAVIVNVANSVEEITSNRLRDVLFGNTREWPSHRRITVVQREPGSAVAVSVLKMFLRMSAEEYNRCLLNLQFRGQQPLAIKVLLSDESACNFVFNAPGAIGFVSAESLEKSACLSQVRVLRISDKAGTFHPNW